MSYIMPGLSTHLMQELNAVTGFIICKQPKITKYSQINPLASSIMTSSVQNIKLNIIKNIKLEAFYIKGIIC